MGTESIRRDLARLPYMEMRELASQIAGKIERGDSEDMAVVLASLSEVGLTEMEQEEDRILQNFFSRKRNLNIKYDDRQGQWIVDCPTMTGASTIGTTLRQAVSDCIDRIAAFHTMGI